MDDLEENPLFSETSIWKTAGQKVVPGTRKNHFSNCSCFSWMMIPNLYIKKYKKNGCFTKHPWKKWLFRVPGEQFLNLKCFGDLGGATNSLGKPPFTLDLAWGRWIFSELGRNAMFFIDSTIYVLKNVYIPGTLNNHFVSGCLVYL